MRKKFKIYYPSDHPTHPGEVYKPPSKRMICMNSSGVFFLYHDEDYYPTISKLSDVLPKYDVVWND